MSEVTDISDLLNTSIGFATKPGVGLFNSLFGSDVSSKDQHIYRFDEVMSKEKEIFQFPEVKNQYNEQIYNNQRKSQSGKGQKRSYNQGVWQKRYRNNQKHKMSQLEEEVTKLQEHLTELNMINKQLKIDKNIEQENVDKQKEEKQSDTDFKTDLLTDKDNFEDENNISIQTPNMCTINLRIIHWMDFQNMKSVYKEFYIQFKSQLIQLDNNEHKILAYEKLKDTALNFDKFITYSRVENGHIYEQLINYNFEIQDGYKRDIDEIYKFYKHCENIINFNEEQHYNLFVVTKMMLSYIELKTLQMKRAIDQISKAQQYFDENKQSQDSSVTLDPSMMTAIVNFYQLFTSQRRTLIKKVENNINSWLEPQMIAKVVVQTYPIVPCFKEFALYLMKNYVEKNNACEGFRKCNEAT